MMDDVRGTICIAFQAKLGRWVTHTTGLHPGLLTLRSWRLPDAPVKQQWSFSTQRRRGFRDSLLGVLRASCGYTPGLLSRTPTLPSPEVTHRPRTTVTDCSLRSGQLLGKERLMIDGGGWRIFPSPQVTLSALADGNR